MPLSILIELSGMADFSGKSTCEETGRVGGLVRAQRLTAQQRREIARKAAKARWQKKPTPPLLPFPPNGGDGKPGRQLDNFFLIRRKRRRAHDSLSLFSFSQAVAA